MDVDVDVDVDIDVECFDGGKEGKLENGEKFTLSTKALFWL